MSATIRKHYEIQLSSGLLTDVDVEIKGVYESDYGADRDGNRGKGMWLVEDVDYDFPISGINEEGKWKLLSTEDYTELTKLVDEEIDKDDLDF
jgi:hypothetical protein